MNKLILIIVTIIFIFSGLQDVSAYSLQEDIEYLSSISTPFNTAQSECVYSPTERIQCQYNSGKLRIATFFYDNGESSIIVVWKLSVVAVVERGVLHKFSNGGGWQGYVHKTANKERHSS